VILEVFPFILESFYLNFLMTKTFEKAMKKSRVTFQDAVPRTESTVVVYHDVCLKKDDIDLLRGPFWLNDQIIAFYFQYLESHKFKPSSGNMLFVPPAVTQLLKMSPAEETKKILEPLNPGNRKKLIFFAVNDNESTRAGGTHWSLLVFSQVEETFFSFDSMRSLNRKATKKIVELLKLGLNCPSATLHEHDCTLQINSYDCGIHLLANVENIATYFLDQGVVRHVPKVPHSMVFEMRQEILELIEEMGGKL
jgi:sentrin-specific protease 8